MDNSILFWIIASVVGVYFLLYRPSAMSRIKKSEGVGVWSILTENAIVLIAVLAFAMWVYYAKNSDTAIGRNYHSRQIECPYENKIEFGAFCIDRDFFGG